MLEKLKFEVNPHSDFGLTFKAEHTNEEGLVRTKTISAESFYRLLSELMEKDLIQFDSGYLPKSLVRVQQTTNSVMLTYHYESIVYDYRISHEYAHPENILPTMNIEIERYGTDHQNSSCHGGPAVFKNLELKDVIVVVTIPQDLSSRIKYSVSYRVPNTGSSVFGGSADNHLSPNDTFISFGFPNAFSDGHFCWGSNRQLENLFEGIDRPDNDIPRLAKIYDSLIYSFLSTEFNGDIPDRRYTMPWNMIQRPLPEEVAGFRDAMKDFYGMREFNPERRELMNGYAAPLLMNFLAKNPQYWPQYMQVRSIIDNN